MEVADFFEENGVDLYDMVCENLIIHAGNIGGYADFTQSDPRDNIKEDKAKCLVKIDSNTYVFEKKEKKMKNSNTDNSTKTNINW